MIPSLQKKKFHNTPSKGFTKSIFKQARQQMNRSKMEEGRKRDKHTLGIGRNDQMQRECLGEGCGRKRDKEGWVLAGTKGCAGKHSGTRASGSARGKGEFAPDWPSSKRVRASRQLRPMESESDPWSIHLIATPRRKAKDSNRRQTNFFIKRLCLLNYPLGKE